MGHLGVLSILRAAPWKLASVDVSFWLLVRVYQKHAAGSLAGEGREELRDSLPRLPLCLAWADGGWAPLPRATRRATPGKDPSMTHTPLVIDGS